MAAACAGGDDNGAEGLAANLLSEGFGDLQGELIFGSQHSKRSGHATAASVEQTDVASVQPAGEAWQEGRIHERFDVAMRMDNHVRGFRVEMESVRLVIEESFDELFEKKTALGDLLRA